MSKLKSRRPGAFRLDARDVAVAALDDAAALRRSASVLVTPEPDVAAVREPADVPMPVPRRSRRWAWGALFWSAAAGLVLLGLGMATINLIEDLYGRAAWLGGTGLLLAALAGLALIAIIVREVLGLARLATIETLRRRAVAVATTDDRTAAAALCNDLLTLTKRMPQLARARARLSGHFGDIIDGRDLVRLAERELMTPLDAQARRLVASAAQRVSVVTAVSPRAAVDMLFVLVNAVGLVRRLSTLYGGRPGTIGMMRLVRHVVSHLAMTGGMAASDSLVQQVIGHGLAAKLSARLGEGLLNGLLTARLGLAAIEVTRPLPFDALRQPTLNDLVGSMLRAVEEQDEVISESHPVA